SRVAASSDTAGRPPAARPSGTLNSPRDDAGAFPAAGRWAARVAGTRPAVATDGTESTVGLTVAAAAGKGGDALGRPPAGAGWGGGGGRAGGGGGGGRRVACGRLGAVWPDASPQGQAPSGVLAECDPPLAPRRTGWAWSRRRGPAYGPGPARAGHPGRVPCQH